jgi:hypothetical protein
MLPVLFVIGWDCFDGFVGGLGGFLIRVTFEALVAVAPVVERLSARRRCLLLIVFELV